jgi:hypothetical protein
VHARVRESLRKTTKYEGQIQKMERRAELTSEKNNKDNREAIRSLMLLV